MFGVGVVVGVVVLVVVVDMVLVIVSVSVLVCVIVVRSCCTDGRPLKINGIHRRCHNFPETSELNRK